ncbi:MAG: PLP-dependent aminotransferase family protein [Nonomuraea sp.]|nr:PLP-dependent aminotransferase family protein [Nonomuraea sp.]NUP68578.1 PLP-dependent aminotransferase family protein [Nonomuraea sp.]NUP79294.1 PLP-dependent aminotransferase family protein [Nonomuraea sp.]NUS05810.1 PLP-dependent aminotransferase family protein [Nonomuraea sp.]NUT43391.1 PLP-dependent aminotransferase family protein [Thermoactinospora sp.]
MLPIAIDRGSRLPMTGQIQSAIRGRIQDGTLHPGVRLPSSRDLARDLGVSRSVVVEAYGQLVAEGYLRATQGSGTRVATHLPDLGRAASAPARGAEARFDLRVDATNTVLFPSREWLQAYEHVGRSIGEPGPRRHPLGVPELRAELAAYLGRSRGVLATGAEVAVTADFDHTVGVVCHVLRELGAGHLAVENPGPPWQARLAEQAGLAVSGVPVDGEGVDVGALARSGARAVLVTPVSQVPTGVVLSPGRREALLRWAAAVDGWVIEYDRDGHLWFGVGSGPLALQRRLPERVIYVGATGALLGSCVRLGWAVAPESVTERLGRAQLGAPDPLTQLTFAHFISSGMLDQHVRQVRGVLRDRRSALRDAVEKHLPGARMTGVPAGTHAYIQWPDGVDDVRLAAVARARSVLVHPGRHFQLGHRPSAPGVVVGYGAVRGGRLPEAVEVLAAAMRQVTGLLAS